MKYIYFLFLFNVSIIFSQDGPPQRFPPQIMSPSPTPSALGKFVDQPVSLYTGIPSIQIPLWEIKLNDFTLPIELKYHSGGIKVQEAASNVGLGWALNAGGVITRAVKGNVPDDFAKLSQEYYHHANDFDEFPTIGRFWTGKYEVLKNMNMDSPDNQYLDNQLGLAMRNDPSFPYTFTGSNDLEPDVFYYSFGNKSGKFVFDVNGGNQSIELIPHEDIRITHKLDAKGEIIAFTIIDEDGTEYFFDTVERVQENQFAQTFDPATIIRILKYNSSWYLSKIKTKNKQEVNFEYADEQVYIWQETGASKTQQFIDIDPDDGWPSGKVYDVYTYSISATKSDNAKRLTRIITDNEIIDFNAIARLDVSLMGGLTNPQKAISSIVVNNKFSQLIKKYDLGFDYFVSSRVGVETPDSSDFYRLKLNHVKEHYTPSANKTYSFEYSNIALPNKRSPRQDFWGYFNNNNAKEFTPSNEGRGMIPQIYVYPSLIGNNKYQLNPLCYPYNFTDNYVEPGANRNANPIYAQAGILTSITYPTGGRAEYTYESNDFLYSGCLQKGGGLRINNIKTFEKGNFSNPLTVKNYSYLNEDGTSSGKVTAMPIFTNILKRLTTAFFNYKNISSVSQSKLGTTNGSYVGYKRVTESVSGLGKTVYEYSAPGMLGDGDDTEYGLYKPTKITWISPSESLVPLPSGYVALKNYYVQNHLFPNNYPFPENPDYDWNRGKIKKESYFDELGNIRKEKIYNYATYTKPNKTNKVFGLSYNNLIPNVKGKYLFHYYVGLVSKYSLITNKANILESVETKDYESPSTYVTTTEKYKYNSAYHKKMMQNISYDSSNKELRTEYQYTADLLLPPHLLDKQKPYMEELYDLNYLAPITTKKFVANQKVSEEEVAYGQFNLGSYLPKAIFSTKGAASINLFNTNDRKIEFIKYDTYGNVQEYKLENGVPVSIIWGYNNSQPIAKIENASYLLIAIALGKTTGIVNNYNETNLNIINSLRVYLPDAMVTTYTYKPLVGITSITDPKGDTITYTYDEFGRLEFVKDKDNKILTESQYNYKQ
ncbi:RHS repeat protein [Flavobacterium sp. F-65]|uniref:RHS repeat protein n=1 Tax=Flavobacterium pisciphilum TaxID=2893755 RepID=A0ABS8MWS3_9FLAO|nr:RHS repeat domain-containing protein [Flavobacterium sp. F-65]MCC9073224.1 RHS repeat protein [Flavobacterium sp. F-65]